MSSDPFESFSPRTCAWFRQAFAAPTPAQEQAWPAIASGDHVLISAPTGSGKTLAAFLWAIDRLASQPGSEEANAGQDGGRNPHAGTSLVYVSPLNALTYDIEPNLRAPPTRLRADLTAATRTRPAPQRAR